VGELYLDARLDFLRSSQNADGGWGYFPGKQSWLEPTTYAMLALQGTPDAEEPLDRGWKLVRSWQTGDGSSRPNGQVREGTWVTAHAVTLACVRGVYDEPVRRSVDWLLQVAGAENRWLSRTFSYFHWLKTDADFSHPGWPWHEGNSSWVEPTAHTLVALKKVAGSYRSRKLDDRVREGEMLIFTRRCQDGGWNCGNPNNYKLPLPSYPETTALALIGLQGSASKQVAEAVQVARKFRGETKSSLAKAWLEIALRCHGDALPAPPENAKVSADVMLAALEAIGHPAGNYKLLGTGVHA
jgi:hypothetical protein